jgi:hypothetical protein
MSIDNTLRQLEEQRPVGVRVRVYTLDTNIWGCVSVILDQNGNILNTFNNGPLVEIAFPPRQSTIDIEPTTKKLL